MLTPAGIASVMFVMMQVLFSLSCSFIVTPTNIRVVASSFGHGINDRFPLNDLQHSLGQCIVIMPMKASSLSLAASSGILVFKQ